MRDVEREPPEDDIELFKWVSPQTLRQTVSSSLLMEKKETVFIQLKSKKNFKPQSCVLIKSTTNTTSER